MLLQEPSHLPFAGQELHKLPYLLGAFLKGIVLLGVLLSVGIVGFTVIEGWSLLEALYMTVITVSTVGYTEVHPLSPTGRVFVCGYIIASMLVSTYALTILGGALFQGELAKVRGVFRMQKAITQLSGHIVVCGYSTELQHVMVRELLDLHQDVVVLSNDQQQWSELERLGVLCVFGDPNRDAALCQAGVKRAKALLALMPSDADNVFVTLSARSFNQELIIMAITNVPDGEKKLYRAGANHVISPHKVSSTRMLQTLLNPYVNDFLEIAADEKGRRLILEQVVIKKGARLTTDTLLNLKVRQETGVTIAGIRYSDGETSFELGGDTTVPAGSTLIVLGTDQALEKLERIFL